MAGAKGRDGEGPDLAAVEARVNALVERGLQRYGAGDLVGAVNEWEHALALDGGALRAREYIEYVRDNFAELDAELRLARGDALGAEVDVYDTVEVGATPPASDGREPPLDLGWDFDELVTAPVSVDGEPEAKVDTQPRVVAHQSPSERAAAERGRSREETLVGDLGEESGQGATLAALVEAEVAIARERTRPGAEPAPATRSRKESSAPPLEPPPQPQAVPPDGIADWDFNFSFSSSSAGTDLPSTTAVDVPEPEPGARLTPSGDEVAATDGDEPSASGAATDDDEPVLEFEADAPDEEEESHAGRAPTVPVDLPEPPSWMPPDELNLAAPGTYTGEGPRGVWREPGVEAALAGLGNFGGQLGDDPATGSARLPTSTGDDPPTIERRATASFGSMGGEPDLGQFADDFDDLQRTRERLSGAHPRPDLRGESVADLPPAPPNVIVDPLLADEHGETGDAGDAGDEVTRSRELRDLVGEVAREAVPAPDRAGEEQVSMLWGQAVERAAAGDSREAAAYADEALAGDETAVAALIAAEHVALCRVFEVHLGAMEQVPLLAVPIGQISTEKLDHRAGFLLSRVDGLLSFEDIFDVSGMSRLDVLRVLSRLLRLGFIEVR